MIIRSKRGVSPVVASIVLVAVTLAVGLAVWGFVISEAGVSSGAMGEATASNINTLRERFVITNVAFDYDGSIPGSSSDKVTVWFYNNGLVTTKIKQVFIVADSPDFGSPIGTFTSNPSSFEAGQSCYIVFDYATTSGTTYYIKAVGEFGNIHTYYQRA